MQGRLARTILRNTWWILIIAVIGFMASIAIDAKSALVNMLTDMVSLAIGIWVAVTIVEAILDQQRDREWQRVRELSRHSIMRLTDSIAYGCNRLLPVQNRVDGVLQLQSMASDTRIKVLSTLVNVLEAPDIRLLADARQARVLFERNVQEYRRLRDTILPMTIATGDDTILVELLQKLDTAGYDVEIAFMRTQNENIDLTMLEQSTISVLRELTNIESFFLNSNVKGQN